MFYPIGATADPNPGTASVKVNPDGSAVVYVGAAEIGQGSNTVLAQIAAEELGLAWDQVTVVSADTKLTPYDPGSVASRVTYIAGNAVRAAAAQAKTILLEAAAKALGAGVKALEMEGGEILAPATGARITVAEAARQAYFKVGRPPMGVASFNPDTTPLDPETGQGRPYQAYVFATQIAEVEVDTETGQVEVLKVVAVHDCGRAINPLLVQGQVEGGVSMGLGYGLMEKMVVEEGAVKNPNLHTYLVPTACDLPAVEVGLVEEPEPSGPFGAKGIGEPALLPTAPAIANAIYDAVGIKVGDLPATPESIWRQLQSGSDGT